MIRRPITLLALAVALSWAPAASAQWRTESFDLIPGWQAIYLQGNTGEESITSLLAPYPQIEEVWRWRPNALDPRILDSPEEPVTGPEWMLWKSTELTSSTLSTFYPNSGYLVRVADGAAPFTLRLKGAVTVPDIRWRTDGLNLLGFPTNSDSPPSADVFFGPSELIDQSTEIYGYRGGALIEGTNPAELLPRFATVKRGVAYWIRTNRYADYDGPLRVRAAIGEGLDFGSGRSAVRIILTNRADRPLTAILTPVGSEAPPGEVAPPDPLPLTRAESGPESTVFVPFGAAHSVALRAGETLGITVGIDRAAMAGAPGDLLYSLVKVTDSEGLSEFYLPARAEVVGLAGLWAGKAEITHVQNQLQRFQMDDDGNFIVGDDGRHVPEYQKDDAGELVTGPGGEPVPVADTGLNQTAQVFSLSVIVHVDDAGKARLLSQAFLGAVAEDADGLPVAGVTTREDRLLAGYLESASRIATVHLPPGTDLPLNGMFAVGAPVSGSLAIAHGSPDNPFIHTYHPDHDNLDARFESPLPEGVESYRIDRALTLSIDNGPGEITDPSWGTTLLTGTYAETFSGLHKNPIAVSGVFALRKISEAPAITGAP